MKFRVHRPEIDPREEESLVREIRRLSAGEPASLPPTDPYWPNMLIRVNRRIDEASSGVAVSLSDGSALLIGGHNDTEDYERIVGVYAFRYVPGS